MRIIYILIVIILVVSFGIYKARKPIPFQEIIPQNNSIVLVDAGGYFTEKINIALKNENKTVFKGKYDKNGFCYINDLKMDMPYELTFSRTDFKGLLLYKNTKVTVGPLKEKYKYIVLVGASVGHNWDFPNIASRIGENGNFVFGSRAIYNFDKSQEIDRLIKLKGIVSYVIIKECAAYFPRDLDESLSTIDSWVEKLREAKIEPILATAVSVTEAHHKKNKERLNSILAYNDEIKKYAKKKRLHILDLEKAVRISDKNRFLKNEFATDDGYHLIQKGYDEGLDPILKDLLNEL